MLNLLTPFGITQIAIVTALAVAVIALVALNIYLIVRARRKKQAGHGEPVIVYVSVPAPAAEPEAAKEPQPVIEAQPVEEQAVVEEPAVIKADITPEEEELLSRLKLDRSYTAKLVQTEEETKQLYAELKRELLSYAGVHSRISWRRETYSKSREPLARFGVRGKTLCLYLALQPADFAESKYKAEDASGHSSFVDTPLMYRIKNPLRMRYAKELIGILMTGRGIERAEYAGEDPMTGLEYRSTPVLIDEGLIRVPAGMELPVFIEPVQEIAATEDPQPVEEQAVVEEPVDEPAEEPTEEIVDEQQEETNGQTEETIALSAEEPPIIAEPQYIEEEVQPVVEEAQPEVIESQPIIEEPQPEDIEVQPVVEEPQSEAVEEAQPVEEQTGVEEPAEEQAEEKPTEPKEESTAELVDEQPEEPAEREIPVVGVVFRRRAKKIYWFDPDGKEWQRDEVAIYTTPEGVRTEVVVVEVTRRAEGLLHLPLKALEKLEG